MKLYEIVVRSSFDDGYFKTALVMSCTPITKETEGINVMADLSKDAIEEWGEYIHSVSQKRVRIVADNNDDLSAIASVLHAFGQ